MKKIILSMAVVALMATGCATGYDTEKSFWTGNTGFSQTQLGQDLWQIDFTGNTYTDRAVTKKYALKKAAQIAISQGYPYFTVVQGDTNRDVTGSNVERQLRCPVSDN